MDAHDIMKALEGWSLQTGLDVSLLLGFFAFGLALLGGYVASLRSRLTLRVSAELLDVGVVVGVDLLLSLAVMMGYLYLNADVMADIKVAVPFMPVATVLLAAALVLRLFHGGHHVGSGAHRAALWLMGGATLLNGVGYSLVMEAASSEYLALHPSPFWEWIKSHLRSNASPHGLELAWTSFIICYPLLLAIFAWAVIAATRALRDTAAGR